MNASSQHSQTDWSRREFIGGTLAAAAGVSAFMPLPGLAAEDLPPASRAPVKFTRRIKLGVIGNGGRGAWIAKQFHQHGG
jgi:hypothetical protein